MSKIEWTQKTWNPIAGCTKVSDGCKNCYAERMAHRFSHTAKYAGTTDNGRWTGKIKLDTKALNAPIHNKKPTLYFVNSMSDLFHENVPDEWIAQIFAVMYEADWHTFQILTKRPSRMVETIESHYYEFGDLGDGPPKHIWLGVSVENQQAADERIPLLLQTPAAVRFLSCEPLLGPIEFSDVSRRSDAVSQLGKPALFGIDWVIVGGESGPGARPMHPGWARSLRDQCQAAGVRFFFKQWGHWAPRNGSNGDTPFHKCLISLDDLAVTMTPCGKAKAGRILDGRTWDEMPEVVPCQSP